MKTIRHLGTAFAVMAAFALTAFSQVSLTALDGSQVDVKGQRGKVVILAIGARWLPLSVDQVNYTNALAKKYSGRDVVVYFVSTDSANPKSKNFASNDDLKKFATVNKLSVPILRDADGTATTRKLSLDQLPVFVILDKNGNAVGQPFAGLSPNYDITVPISKAVDKLL
jgi:hypothetical protein